MLEQTKTKLAKGFMTQSKGYSITRIDGVTIASGLRFNDARRKLEVLINDGHSYRIKPDPGQVPSLDRPSPAQIERAKKKRRKL